MCKDFIYVLSKAEFLNESGTTTVEVWADDYLWRIHISDWQSNG